MRKQSRYLTAWSSTLAMLVALTWAAPSEAARVLDLRMGRHAEFTRIVFELDSPAGYKVERHEPVSGVAELMISLEASGPPTELKGSKRRVDSVSLEPAGPGRSLVRIRLSRDGLRLKEMILAGPPRIVLDILGGEPETLTAAAAPPKATPPPIPKPDPAAVEPIPEPSVPDVVVVEEVEGEPVEASIEASEILDARVDAEPRDGVLAGGSEFGSAPAGNPEAAVDLEEAAGAEPSAGAFDEFGTGAEEPDRVAMARAGEAGSDIAEPTRPAARPVTPERARRGAAPEQDSMFSVQNIALAAGALLLVAGGLVFMRRRRSKGPEFESSEPEGENPFSSFAAPPADAESVDSHDSAGATVEAVALFDDDTAVDAMDVAAEQSLFDSAADEAAKKEAEMETATSVIEPGVPMPAVGDDVMRLIRELERRVTSLETRLDDAVDTKERLERQVAAQTEELRVQRAAIARTQRAVRNLNRSDDEGATEPAERES